MEKLRKICGGFAFSNEPKDGLELTSEPIVSCMQEVINNRVTQVKKLLSKQGGTFYFFHVTDES